MPDKAELLKASHAEFQKYLKWLQRHPVSDETRRAYRNRVEGFLGFLGVSGENLLELVDNDRARLHVLREYKRYMKQELKLLPSTVNAKLTALDNFFQYLGSAKTKVAREDLPQESPRALSPEEQKRFLRAIAGCRRSKDRAIALLFYYTGIRIGECASLELDDVSVIGRKNRVIVRNGKGDRYREIPLHRDACEAISAWLVDRKKFEKSPKFEGKKISKALFLNPQGNGLSTASMDLIVRKIGQACGLEISAHRLRHSCLTNLYRQTKNLVLVSEIGGHKRLETTRRYTLPSEDDKKIAIENL